MNATFYLLCATQIIAESFPISSSSHVEFIQQFLGQRLPAFVDHFAHGPTIMVIMLAFFDAWFTPVRMMLMVLRAWWRRGISFSSLSYSHRTLLTLFAKIISFVVVADVITFVCYAILGSWVKQADQVVNEYALLVGLVITALLLLSLRLKCLKSTHVLTLSNAFLLGLIQGLALLPGISRFASTYVCARWLGLSPRRSMQFSFLILFPLIVAAFCFHGIPAIVALPEGGVVFSLPFMMTSIVATVIAYVALRVAYRMALHEMLWWFGVYMLLPIVYVAVRLIGW